MAKWIELNDGRLVNLDNVCSIHKYCYENINEYSIYYYSPSRETGWAEFYSSEEERDKRFEEVRAMLIKE